MDKTTEILSKRGTTHGDWIINSDVCQALKRTLSINSERRSDSANEALDNVAQKLARIVTGDYSEEDHWQDIIGYTQLELNRLRSKPVPGDLVMEPYDSTKAYDTTKI